MTIHVIILHGVVPHPIRTIKRWCKNVETWCVESWYSSPTFRVVCWSLFVVLALFLLGLEERP